MSKRVEVGGTVSVLHPKPLLPSCLETGIVTFAFRTQGVSSLELQTFSVDSQPIVGRQCFVFRATPVLLPIVPILVIARTFTDFRQSKRATELLAQPTPTVRSFAVLAHGQPGFTDWIAHSELFGVFRTSPVQRNDGLAPINVFDGIVDFSHIIALVRKEDAFMNGYGCIGSGEDISGDSGIRDIGWRGQLIEWQT